MRTNLTVNSLGPGGLHTLKREQNHETHQCINATLQRDNTSTSHLHLHHHHPHHHHHHHIHHDHHHASCNPHPRSCRILDFKILQTSFSLVRLIPGSLLVKRRTAFLRVMKPATVWNVSAGQGGAPTILINGVVGPQ